MCIKSAFRKTLGKNYDIIISSSSSSSSISIQPLGQFGQEPEPIQATSMALVCCVLGKFLGVVCHCFPPLGYNEHEIIF